MPWYYFNISGSVQLNDPTGRDCRNVLDLQQQALLEAASASAQNARRGEETNVLVTVSDVTGAVHLKVRLVSQVESP